MKTGRKWSDGLCPALWFIPAIIICDHHWAVACLCVSHRYVCIAMEALDQLLMACHCQSINLFVESFLTMVRKLLEADKPNLQILGTNSVSEIYCLYIFSSEIHYWCSYRSLDKSSLSRAYLQYSGRCGCRINTMGSGVSLAVISED